MADMNKHAGNLRTARPHWYSCLMADMNNYAGNLKTARPRRHLHPSWLSCLVFYQVKCHNPVRCVEHPPGIIAGPSFQSGVHIMSHQFCFDHSAGLVKPPAAATLQEEPGTVQLAGVTPEPRKKTLNSNLDSFSGNPAYIQMES